MLAAILLSAVFAVAAAIRDAAEHRAEQNRTGELLRVTYNGALCSEPRAGVQGQCVGGSLDA